MFLEFGVPSSQFRVEELGTGNSELGTHDLKRLDVFAASCKSTVI
jgi:hypothetical protein